MLYAVECLFEAYEVDEVFVIVFYAFSSTCLIVLVDRSIILLPCLCLAHSSPNALFILFCIISLKTFPGMLCRLMPLQFLQFCGAHFLYWVDCRFSHSSGNSSSG